MRIKVSERKNFFLYINYNANYKIDLKYSLNKFNKTKKKYNTI